MSQVRPDYLSLSVAERIQLAEDIWDSVVAEESETATLTTAQEREVKARLDAHDDDPTTSIPWSQVRSELLSSNH